MKRRQFIALLGGAAATGRSRSVSSATPYGSHGPEQSLGETRSRALYARFNIGERPHEQC